MRARIAPKTSMMRSRRVSLRPCSSSIAFAPLSPLAFATLERSDELQQEPNHEQHRTHRKRASSDTRVVSQYSQ